MAAEMVTPGLQVVHAQSTRASLCAVAYGDSDGVSLQD